jgi:hypothetical protein
LLLALSNIIYFRGVTVNKISFKLISFLLSLTALTFVSNTGSARAQTPNADSFAVDSASIGTSIPVDAPMNVVESSTPLSATSQTVEPAVNPVIAVDPLDSNPNVAPISEGQLIPFDRQQTDWAEFPSSPADTQTQPIQTVNNHQPNTPTTLAEAPKAEAIPGTLSTSATHLTEQPQTSPRSEVYSEQAEDTSVAQSIEDIEPGRASRGGRSYIGIGGNLGLSGDTAIGQGAFMINSKIGLTRNISFRPAVLIGESTDFLLPLTYDFILQSADPFQPIPFAPFVGGGVAFSTSDDNTVGFLVTGGADVPLSAQFIANARVNAGFFGDTTSIGISLGVGYQFSGLGF